MTIALVAICGNTLKVLLALGALEVPTGAGIVLSGLLAALAIILRVVLAVAAFPCAPVTGVPMPMALARSAAVGDVSACYEEALHTLLALGTHRVVLAEAAHG